MSCRSYGVFLAHLLYTVYSGAMNILPKSQQLPLLCLVTAGALPSSGVHARRPTRLVSCVRGSDGVDFPDDDPGRTALQGG